jgi:bifunctional non-homologous end joining protein LigD
MRAADVKLSNVDKVFFAAAGLSKGDVLDHYRAVAEVMVPHLAGRPLTLRRYPDGIEGNSFFQKDAGDKLPDWIRVETVPQRQGGTIRHIICDDAATLIHLANLATIEFHIWPSTTADLEHPDRLVIDIDPPPGTTTRRLRGIARKLADLYRQVGLTPFVQATGGRGFHVVAPLDRTADFESTRALANNLADHLAVRHQETLTTAQRKDKRGDRVFLDTNRNAYGQTFVAPYSLRARETAGVATPLDWPELRRAEPDGFQPSRVRNRLARKPDPWQDLDKHASSVETAQSELDTLRP